MHCSSLILGATRAAVQVNCLNQGLVFQLPSLAVNLKPGCESPQIKNSLNRFS
jgi:hypothetical protein